MVYFNVELIECFYQVFQCFDGEVMVVCYVFQVIFYDLVFGELCGCEVGDMWCLLISWVWDFCLDYVNVCVDENEGCV